MKQRYIVIVDDNYHFTDTNERYKDSEHSTYLSAVRRCQTIVGDYLESAIEPGMTAKQLYSSYTMFGEDPFIDGETDNHFSAWKYAEEKSKKIAGSR